MVAAPLQGKADAAQAETFRSPLLSFSDPTPSAARPHDHGRAALTRPSGFTWSGWEWIPANALFAKDFYSWERANTGQERTRKPFGSYIGRKEALAG